MICDFISEFQVTDDKIVNQEEGITYEFKENFNWGSRERYAKIISSFANASGGYLLFGIKDDGHVVGLSNNSFETRDPADVTSFLNSLFTPAILWSKFVCNLGGYKIGVIKVEEASEKPIMSYRNGQEVKEGDIFFRYAGKSEKIKISELKAIIETGKRMYGEKLLKSLRMIVEKGPESVKLLDLGKLKEAKEGEIYILDDDLSNWELKVHRATEDEEAKGIGIKIVNVEGKAVPITVKEFANISSELIVHAFLDQDLPANFDPMGFVERLAFETSGLVPLYFYIRKANLTRAEAVEIIKKTKSTTRGRYTILKRLSGKEYDFNSLAHGKTLDNLIDGSLKLSELQTSNVKAVLQSIRSCSKSFLEQNWNRLKDIIGYLYDEYYMNPKFRSEVRWTICFIDVTLFS
ncbi:MAG: ATP-binding protein [Thermoplasmata archaeon]